MDTFVAPARERGLKSQTSGTTDVSPQGRSREGAWIEIRKLQNLTDQQRCRSREGAWIEMPTGVANLEVRAVAPARERGLKCPHYHVILFGYDVAPARERGLK